MVAVELAVLVVDAAAVAVVVDVADAAKMFNNVFVIL